MQVAAIELLFYWFGCLCSWLFTYTPVLVLPVPHSSPCTRGMTGGGGPVPVLLQVVWPAPPNARCRGSTVSTQLIVLGLLLCTTFSPSLPPSFPHSLPRLPLQGCASPQ